MKFAAIVKRIGRQVQDTHDFWCRKIKDFISAGDRPYFFRKRCIFIAHFSRYLKGKTKLQIKHESAYEKAI